MSGIETSGIKAFCEGGGGLGAGYPFKQVCASLADGLGKLTTLSLSPKKILHRNKIALKTVALKMGDLNYKLCLQRLGGYWGGLDSGDLGCRCIPLYELLSTQKVHWTMEQL